MTDQTAVRSRRTDDELRAMLAAANPVPALTPYPTRRADAMLESITAPHPSAGTAAGIEKQGAGHCITVPRRVSVLRSRRRPVRRLGVGALCAAAAAIAAIVVPGVWTTPAYAVQAGPHGTVHVQVNRLEQAAGLQRALARYGIHADVQYLGHATKCQPERYEAATAEPGSSTRFSVGEGIDIDIDRRDVAHGETVVIAASRVRNGVYAEVGIAKTAVQDCRPIPIGDTPAH